MHYSCFIPALALVLSTSAWGSSLGLQSIQAPDCSNPQFQAFCALVAYTGVDEGTQIDPPQPPLVAYATESGQTSFGGVHSSLYANGAYDPATGTGPSALASYSGATQEYLTTTSLVPNEFWDISISLSATGDSAHTLTQSGGEDYSTSVSLGIGIPGATVSCPTGVAFNDVNGSVNISCTAMVPVEPLGIVNLYYEAYSHASSNLGPATLQMSAGITSISIVDSNGVPDLNAQLFDESGFNYNVSQVATPEPRTAALLSLPLLLIAVSAAYRARR